VGSFDETQTPPKTTQKNTVNGNKLKKFESAILQLKKLNRNRTT